MAETAAASGDEASVGGVSWPYVSAHADAEGTGWPLWRPHLTEEGFRFFQSCQIRVGCCRQLAAAGSTHGSGLRNWVLRNWGAGSATFGAALQSEY